MSDEPDWADVPEIVLTRKPAPEAPPPFVCVICQETITVDPWHFARKSAEHRPPICAGCARHWGARSRVPGTTRRDASQLQRLTAITTRLVWETFNGRYGKWH